MNTTARITFKALIEGEKPSPPAWPWVVVLAAFYLLPGTAGHDPWKTEDAIHLGIAAQIFSGNPWAPAIAGEPWPHTPPLYHWIAAFFGHLFAPYMAFHGGARFATTFFASLLLFALARAARHLYGETAARLSPLLALTTLALIEWVHEAQPALAGLAFAAIAWWGATLALKGGWRHGALLIGIGSAAAFAAYGLAGLAMAAAPLIAPLLRAQTKGALIAWLVAALGIGFWLWLGHHYAPSWWSAWWANEWAEATRARRLPEVRHLEQVLWLAWPLLPLAAVTLWQRRRRFDASIGLPLFGALAALLWYGSGSPRSLSFLPALLPLALLAAAESERLRRGLANAFDWFALATFSVIAALIWLGAAAQGLGWPERIARNFEKLAPGHQAEFPWPLLAFAALLTLAWILQGFLRRTPWRPLLRWSLGMTLMWGLISALWMPWIDHYKSYRAVASQIAQRLPAASGCIAREGLGPAHRALFDYHAGIRTVAGAKASLCAWRIQLSAPDFEPPPGWRIVWSGGRPSDRKERWYLLERLTDEGDPSLRASENSPDNT
ncbi:MAG: glycosyltransferase family 39 protein [Rhodocyclaceae bacterium]|nr:glycosyltransferase family 39 protein [Rhodocyclaceae bacterium]